MRVRERYREAGWEGHRQVTTGLPGMSLGTPQLSAIILSLTMTCDRKVCENSLVSFCHVLYVHLTSVPCEMYLLSVSVKVTVCT